MGESRASERTLENEAEITLGLLNAVHENSTLTQRSAAHDLGIALGLTNAYLKRCVKKGLIKAAQAPTNRFAYYLTPKGFAEKSRLTAEYLSSSFGFFRKARAQCAEALETCDQAGWQRVALAGVSDLCDVLSLSAGDYDLRLVGIVDRRSDKSHFARLPVIRRLADMDNFDAVIITDLDEPQTTYQFLLSSLPAERILTPDLLQVSRSGIALAEQLGNQGKEKS